MSAVEVIGAVDVPRGGYTFAPAMKAGPWLFASGHMATDHVSGIDPAVLAATRDLRAGARQEAEASHIFARLAGLLEQAGTDVGNIVRLDQYYRDWRTVPHYHRARHKAFTGTQGVPASTSILQAGLLYPDASLHVEMLAHTCAGGEIIEVMRPDGLPVSPHMGFAPIVRVGDMLFLSGQMAEKGNDGIAPEAKVPGTHHWKGSAIRLETDYIIRNKLKPALETGGATLADVVKAQAYLSDPNDIPAFHDVWSQWFGEVPVALTVVPCANPGFNVIEASIEINIVAMRTDRGAERRAISAAGVSPVFSSSAAAVRAGDLLMISGLIACDADGLIPAARPDGRQPNFGSTAKAQMRHVLDQAEALCAAAGTSLDNVVRIQQFQTDLREFPQTVETWQERLGSRPLPISAVGVPGPLPVDEATVQLDLWVYVPPVGAG